MLLRANGGGVSERGIPDAASLACGDGPIFYERARNRRRVVERKPGVVFAEA